MDRAYGTSRQAVVRRNGLGPAGGDHAGSGPGGGGGRRTCGHRHALGGAARHSALHHPDHRRDRAAGAAGPGDERGGGGLGPGAVLLADPAEALGRRRDPARPLAALSGGRRAAVGRRCGTTAATGSPSTPSSSTASRWCSASNAIQGVGATGGVINYVTAPTPKSGQGWTGKVMAQTSFDDGVLDDSFGYKAAGPGGPRLRDLGLRGRRGLRGPRRLLRRRGPPHRHRRDPGRAAEFRQLVALRQGGGRSRRRAAPGGHGQPLRAGGGATTSSWSMETAPPACRRPRGRASSPACPPPPR